MAKRLNNLIAPMKQINSAKSILLSFAILAAAAGVSHAKSSDEPVLSRGEIMNKALDEINEIPEFLQFYDLFPNAKFVLDNESTFEEPRIEGRVLLNRRYSFNIGITFKVSETGVLEAIDDVDFQLQEISRVRKKGNGVYAEYENEWQIENADFSKLLEAQGDFSELGISLNSSAPVKHVMKYWENMTG